ncbi:TerC family protein [Bdellovibrio sp. SKB1291214]|uniref:TerC family protein n=1 Tax=Bdellovibrio sp. SKB1291214 TaxID=1732569 RepID=UPI000B517612|nr:TerC family protein [Bdellovibrio sp. SKB1291214]UYL07482.1 TerC family protein [Bdellovibrio sp. SKB1291214]
MIEMLSNPQIWIAFFTLFALELVLGIDNVIFISILAGKLPKEQQDRARVTGLALAVITRVILLFSLSWIIGLTEPLFAVFGQEISGRDLILLLGGLFLIVKSTMEINHKLEGVEGSQSNHVAHSFSAVIFQILLLDVVFSLDSVITAVGMVSEIGVMVAAVVVSAVVMIVSAKSISNFVDSHPSLKILALSFLLMIGFTLIVESLEVHIPKGYVYFAMAFSVGVEMLNIRMRKKKPKEPVKLRERFAEDDAKK